jgi:hypothetical protein
MKQMTMSTRPELGDKRVEPPRRATEWTKERIDLLTTPEVTQLRANAEALAKSAVLALCDEVLSCRPKNGSRQRAAGTRLPNSRHLVSRNKAFEMHGVLLQNARWSWGGVRRADGAVVMTLWADDVQSSDGGCSYLLWAPNINGSRPWSDKPGGKERLEHCRIAMTRGGAEGLLVYGERLEGTLPEDKASSVRGTDPKVLLRFRVTQRGDEFWATWGGGNG